MSVPGYEVGDVIGRGGFAVVYRARQLTIDREVAIKVDSRVIIDERDQRRFLREVRAAGRLSGHPHVVEIYDAGVLADGRPYLVMELCLNGSLSGRAPLPPAEVVSIGHKLADVLVAAQDLGVLHRDIKPGNVLIKRYGAIGLADFGLAALIETGRESSVTLAALTPAYAPPEAFRHETPTAKSDIFALGATLYALLAGRPPRFPAAGELSLPEILRLHDEPVPDLPTVPPTLNAVLRSTLANDPAHRPDAASLRDALGRLSSVPLSNIPVVRRPAPLSNDDEPTHRSAGASQAPRLSAARRGTLAGAAALVVVLVAVTIWLIAVQRDGDNAAAPNSGADTGQAAPTTPDLTARFGTKTVTTDCAAARVVGANARCTDRPECWSGMVVISGVVNSIRPLDCGTEHVFETFAIAEIPAGLAEDYLDVLERNPTVTSLCSIDTLVASRFGEALDHPGEQWSADVLPPTPDDRNAGRRIYRCLGRPSEFSIIGSAFRPR